MSEARIDRISNENNTGGPTLSGITTFSGQNYFVPPRGTTAERPSDCPPGSIRFNTDGAHLEYFDGLQWLELEAFNNELGVNGALGNRGIFSGGGSPAPTSNVLDYVTISTLGNAIDFGDLVNVRSYSGACSSSTRGIWGGGSVGNVMEYVTISSTGNSQDFGDLTFTGGYHNKNACSNATRGLWLGNNNSNPANIYQNVIQYITIATIGNTVDFGDLTVLGSGLSAAFASSTRGVRAGGNRSPNDNVIDYVNIASLGNAQDFGDISAGYGNPSYIGGLSNATRGVFAGGYNLTSMEFVTIATTGNSQDFGDLTQALYYPGAAASSTRGLFAGGSGSSATPAGTNTINYITILSTGNAVDFGDLNYSRGFTGACSNGHGGL